MWRKSVLSQLLNSWNVLHDKTNCSGTQWDFDLHTTRICQKLLVLTKRLQNNFNSSGPLLLYHGDVICRSPDSLEHDLDFSDVACHFILHCRSCHLLVRWFIILLVFEESMFYHFIVCLGVYSIFALQALLMPSWSRQMVFRDLVSWGSTYSLGTNPWFPDLASCRCYLCTDWHLSIFLSIYLSTHCHLSSGGEAKTQLDFAVNADFVF